MAAHSATISPLKAAPKSAPHMAEYFSYVVLTFRFQFLVNFSTNFAYYSSSTQANTTKFSKLTLQTSGRRRNSYTPLRKLLRVHSISEGRLPGAKKRTVLS